MNVNSPEAGVWSPFPGRTSGWRFEWGEMKGKERKQKVSESSDFKVFQHFHLDDCRDLLTLQVCSTPSSSNPRAKRSTKAYPRDGLNTLRFYFFPVLHGMLWKSFLGVPDDSRDCKTRGAGGRTRTTKKRFDSKERNEKADRSFISSLFSHSDIRFVFFLRSAVKWHEKWAEIYLVAFLFFVGIINAKWCRAMILQSLCCMRLACCLIIFLAWNVT